MVQNLLKYMPPSFTFGFLAGLYAVDIANIIYPSEPSKPGDPPLFPTSVDITPFATDSTGVSLANQNANVNPNGALNGSLLVPRFVVSNNVSASWESDSDVFFGIQGLAVATGQVVNASGANMGEGSLTLQSSGGSVAVSGEDSYSVDGVGSLSFYGPSERNLGVSGDWQNYTATVTGNVSITLTVPAGALTLNGQALPAGTYTITTNSAALSGSGTMSAPNFAGTASITATNGTINLGPGSGSLSVGGMPLDPTDETTLDGYSGTISVSANGDGTDSVSLGGNAGNVLQVAVSPATFTTDQNTPLSFQPSIQTSLADTYNLTANAPPGWTVTIDSSGNVTATPAPGLQGGTYPIQIIAQSQTDSNLEAQTTVEVTITPTQPGMTFAVNPDPEFTVPYNGAQVPTAFRTVIDNTGPAADTYKLTFSNIPSGFTLVESATSDTVPAGQTGIVGLYLVPNPGQPIPAQGTQLSFTVTATSTSNSLLTQTQTETFTVPAIDALTFTGSPTSVSTPPGAGVTDTITLTNAGNVPENNVTLTATGSSGLTVTGLTPVSLAVGQSVTETITLTPDASTPVNSTLDTTITATFGPSGTPVNQTIDIPVQVVVPGAQSIASAAVAAEQIGNTNLGNQLNDLSIALTSLVETPTSAVYQGQAVAALTSIISQVTNDPFLAPFASGLTAGSTAIASATTAAEVDTAVINLGAVLDSLAQTITDEAAYGFTLGLTDQDGVIQPGALTIYTIQMRNTGTATATYDFSVSGLPAGVTATFNQTSITLAPGASIPDGTATVTLSLSESGNTLIPADFTVIATAQEGQEITLGMPGRLDLRPESLLVGAVVTNPPFTNPGGQVDVTAKIESVVNEPQQVAVSYIVTDVNGNVLVAASTPVTVPLTITSGLTTVDLGTFDTTGFADGADTVT